MDKLRIAIVKWLDANHHPGWHGRDAIAEMDVMHMETAGWLLEQNDEYILIAQSMGYTKAGDVLCIPVGVVTDVIVLNDDIEERKE